MNQLKENAAKAALDYIHDDMIVGIGTGSTVNYFIDQLATIKHRIDACVASSKATETRLRAKGIPVIDLNVVDELPIYIDSADEINHCCQMIKGGGGALAREKIIASVAHQFICIVDETKVVTNLGCFPIAVEVLPLARSFVARELVMLGGDPIYRNGFITDNGNIILDVYNLDLSDVLTLEKAIKQLTGVIDSGLFAVRVANLVIVAKDGEITTF
jgi:ribose 5-phosphate isomerase A